MLELINELKQEIQESKTILMESQFSSNIQKLITEIQDDKDQFLTNMINLCNNKDTTKNALALQLQARLDEDESILNVNDSVIAGILERAKEEQEETLNNIEKITNKLESKENWKEYKSLC